MPDTKVVTAAGLLLRRATPEGWRWLLLRSRHTNEWGFPKGHQEAGEDLIATALRETAEETGITAVTIDGPPREISYTLRNGRTKRAVYFPAFTEVQKVRCSDEHLAAAWCDDATVRQKIPHANLRALFVEHLSGLPPLTAP